jgi:ribosomal protein L19
MNFKKGDKVRVKSGLVGGRDYSGLYFAPDMKTYCGKTATISGDDGRYYYIDIAGTRWKWNDDMLEKVGFQRGDIIKGTNDHYGVTNYEMKRARVLSVTDGYMNIEVLEHEESGYVNHTFDVLADADMFSIINETKSGTFKVGDIIRGTKKSDSRYSWTTSKMTRAKVLEVDEDEITIKVLEHELESVVGETYTVDANNGYFELIADTKELKIGDKVRVKTNLESGKRYGVNSFVGKMEKYKGKVATIVGHTGSGNYELDVDGGDWGWTREMLEDVSEPVVEVKKIDVGVKVRIKDSHVPEYNDKIATVTRVRGCGHFELDIDKGLYHWDKSELEVVSETKTEVKEKVKKTKEIKVGDRIRVKKNLTHGTIYGRTMVAYPMIAFGGKVATVARLNKGDDSFFIDIDGGEYYWTKEMVEVVSEPQFTPSSETKGMVKYVYIGDITIAVPAGCPIGITKKHPNDEQSKQTGEAIAFSRMMENALESGLIKL